MPTRIENWMVFMISDLGFSVSNMIQVYVAIIYVLKYEITNFIYRINIAFGIMRKPKSLLKLNSGYAF